MIERTVYCYCLLAVGVLSIISTIMVCLPLLMSHLIHHMWTACLVSIKFLWYRVNLGEATNRGGLACKTRYNTS